MNSDISNFFDIHQHKSGKAKLKINQDNRSNIFMFLREQGFRKSIIKGKKVYFQITQENQIERLTEMKKINKFFWDFLEQGRYTNCSSYLSNIQILDCYLRYSPIKDSTLLNYHLRHELNEHQTHSLKLMTDYKYRHQWQVDLQLSKFDEWNFKKTTDKINSYSSKNPSLYYKKIEGDQFLVFNHWNANNKYNDGFDSWITTYTNEKNIGIKHPISIDSIRLGFRLDRDFDLISKYLI